MQSPFIRYTHRVFPLLAIMTLVSALAFGQSQSGQPETKSQDKPFRGGLDQVQNPDNRAQCATMWRSRAKRR